MEVRGLDPAGAAAPLARLVWCQKCGFAAGAVALWAFARGLATAHFSRHFVTVWSSTLWTRVCRFPTPLLVTANSLFLLYNYIL